MGKLKRLLVKHIIVSRVLNIHLAATTEKAPSAAA